MAAGDPVNVPAKLKGPLNAPTAKAGMVPKQSLCHQYTLPLVFLSMIL